MKLVVVLFVFCIALILFDSNDARRPKKKGKAAVGISKKLKFWQQKEENKNKKKSWLEKMKERWNKVKKIQKSKFKAKMILDKLDSHLPKHLKEKKNRGKKLRQSELDKVRFDFMRNRRKEFSITDLIYTVNRGNDVILKEIDIKETSGAPIELGGDKRRRRDAMRERYYLWQNRVVPYEIDSVLESDRDTIEGAMNGIESSTCINFVRRTTEKNWIKFVKKIGCYSNVGKVFFQEGFQEISIGEGCMYHGTIQHEVMHALGFYHEQARPDRDRYVQIFFDNISDDQEHNFEKQPATKADTLNIGYDYSSIMHYGKYAFALDVSKPTIQSIRDPNQEIGQRDSISPEDIRQIKILYSCSISTGGWSAWSDFGPCNVDCYKERSRFCMDANDKTSCPNPTSTAYISYGVDLNKVSCSEEECKKKIDGNWGTWGEWDECNVSCDKGMHSRSRTCSNPAPQNGGSECAGSETETKECFVRSCNADSADCTFDDNNNPTCSWKSETGDFDWTRNSGSTPSSSTGPSSDHTSGTGFYMYIETSSPAQPGWKARLTSPSLSAQARCMKFSYHMYGGTMGTLNVFVRDLVTSQQNNVFSKSDDQLNVWKIAEVTVQSASNDYQIIFEGIRGSSWQSDIAIDDIEITNGACAIAPPPTKPPVPTFARVGCYHDNGFINGRRPFPLYADLSQLAISSTNIDELKANYETIVNYCASLSRSNGFKYFALQNYHQCWTGETSAINYGRDGESTGCWPEVAMQSGPYLVGKYSSNLVYKWNDM